MFRLILLSFSITSAEQQQKIIDSMLFDVNELSEYDL